MATYLNEFQEFPKGPIRVGQYLRGGRSVGKESLVTILSLDRYGARRGEALLP